MKAKPKKRGRKPHKTFKINAGELKEFPLADRFNLRYRATREGWVINMRKINGKLLVFRQS